MVVETNLIDISKITLENYNTYNECIKYEIPKQRELRNIVSKIITELSEEEKKQRLKEYQHQYYMQITKQKIRKEKIGLGGSYE